jgi:hypothetical protein
LADIVELQADVRSALESGHLTFSRHWQISPIRRVLLFKKMKVLGMKQVRRESPLEI